MREINRIVVHHTATPTNTSVDSIRDYHMNNLGWRDIGYHYIIEVNGHLRLGRPDWMIGAHVKGKNSDSIGVAVIGNYQDINFLWQGRWSTRQARTLHVVLTDLRQRYPDVDIVTHRELANTLCPGKNVQAWIDKWRGL